MDIFISWSGPRANAVAVALREWLPAVLDGHVTPFVSSEDVAKGTRGLGKIADELQRADFGIIVITPENADQPWLNFEAGALGNSVTGAKVSPFLVDLDNDAGLAGPVTQFQTTVASEKEDVRRLVTTINAELERPIGAATLATLFEARWSGLETKMAAALTAGPKQEGSPQSRSQDNIVDEILTTVRGLRRDFDRLPHVQKSSVDQRSWSVEQVHKFLAEQGDTPMWLVRLRNIERHHKFRFKEARKSEDGALDLTLGTDADFLQPELIDALVKLAQREGSPLNVSGPRLGVYEIGSSGQVSHWLPAELLDPETDGPPLA